MTRKLALLLVPCLLAVGFAACSGDDQPIAVVDQNFKFTVGDVYTYKYFDRDSTNTRLDASEQQFVWTVLRVDLDTLNESDVVEIEEVRYDKTGANESGRSMLYMSIDGDGQVSVYDLVSTILNRFSGGLDLSLYITQLPKAWVTVGSTNDANARTLLNTQLPIQKNLSNVVVPVPGIDPFDATFMIDARTDHLGAGEIIVASGTYAKAYSTNTNVFVDVTNAEDLELPLIGTLEAGTAMISDSITVHYGIDINDGVLKQESASKVVYLAPSVLGTTIPQNVNGYEMELQSVVKATTE